MSEPKPPRTSGSSLHFEVWQEGRARKWKWRLVINGRVLAISGRWYTRKTQAVSATRHLLKILSHNEALRSNPIHFLVGKIGDPEKVAPKPKKKKAKVAATPATPPQPASIAHALLMQPLGPVKEPV